MFKRKSAATPVRSKSPPLLEKRQYVASPRFYEILDYFAEKLNVPLQFSTFMKKRYSKDQISEPQDFEHLIHSESEQDAEAALKTLSSKIPGTYKNLAKQFPNIKGNRKSQAMGTVVIRDVPDEYIRSSETSEIIPSVETVEKSAAIKIYFENYFYGVLKKPSGRMTRRLLLENELEKMTISEQDKQWIRQELLDLESDYMRLLRKRVAISSFNIVKTIGHGAFGVVKLVREKSSGKFYAMKMMRKADMLKKGQEGHVRAERDILTAAAETAQWIVKLIYSFQDADNLYLVMEYMAGGDLLNLLIERDTFEEDFAKFYVAEMVLAIEEAHRLGYIHRDVKPDNFLFDSDGHIKLSDFGLATGFHWSHDSAYYEQQRKDLLHKTGIDIETDTLTRMMGKKHRSARWSEDWSDEFGDDKVPNTRILTWRDNHRRNLAFSVVGTNNYMAPEVLRNTGYDSRCDWWSLGVIIFEMLYGFPPFCSKSRLATRQKIVNWQQTLRFPARPHLSHEAQDLIKRLICEKEDRLGSSPYAASTRPNSLYAANRRPAMLGANDASEIKAHPWFKGIDWANLHNAIPPFRPKLKNENDTRYFEEIVDDNPLAPPEGEVERKPKDPLLRDKQHGNIVLNTRMQKAFAGYTFRGLPLERLRGGMVERIKQRAAGKEQRLRSRAMSL